MFTEVLLVHGSSMLLLHSMPRASVLIFLSSTTPGRAIAFKWNSSVRGESQAGGMQVMHISAASEINNLLLPSLEMLRARPVLTSVHAALKVTLAHKHISLLVQYQICGMGSVHSTAR